jgi:hypothetical protein
MMQEEKKTPPPMDIVQNALPEALADELLALLLRDDMYPTERYTMNMFGKWCTMHRDQQGFGSGTYRFAGIAIKGVTPVPEPLRRVVALIAPGAPYVLVNRYRS